MKINWRASALHAAFIGVSNSVLQLVASFGVHISGTTNAAITSLLNAVLVLLSVALISATNGPA